MRRNSRSHLARPGSRSSASHDPVPHNTPSFLRPTSSRCSSSVPSSPPTPPTCTPFSLAAVSASTLARFAGVPGAGIASSAAMNGPRPGGIGKERRASTDWRPSALAGLGGGMGNADAVSRMLAFSASRADDEECDIPASAVLDTSTLFLAAIWAMVDEETGGARSVKDVMGAAEDDEENSPRILPPIRFFDFSRTVGVAGVEGVSGTPVDAVYWYCGTGAALATPCSLLAASSSCVVCSSREAQPRRRSPRTFTRWARDRDNVRDSASCDPRTLSSSRNSKRTGVSLTASARPRCVGVSAPPVTLAARRAQSSSSKGGCVSARLPGDWLSTAPTQPYSPTRRSRHPTELGGTA